MWHKPVLKTLRVSELVQEVKVKASSFNGVYLPEPPNIPDYGFGDIYEPGCLIEVCWYGVSCDVIPLA